MNKCDAVSDNMIAYRNLYYYLEGTFDGCKVSHVSRASNEEADNLAKHRVPMLTRTTSSLLGGNHRAINKEQQNLDYGGATDRLGG
jgi:hypothetical protein